MQEKRRVIIAGSRSITDARIVAEILENDLHEGLIDPNRDEIVHGGARGVDSLAAEWARSAGFGVKEFPADWAKYGKRAGFLRNCDMAEYAARAAGGKLVLIWDGHSRGSAMMKEIARKAGLSIEETVVGKGSACER